MSQVARKTFMKNWYAVEVRGIILPILASVGFGMELNVRPLTVGYPDVSPFGLSYPSCSGPSGGGGIASSRWGVLVLWMGLADVSTSYTIIGGVVAGAGWYLYRLARGPEGQSFLLSLSRSLGNTHV